MMYLIGSRALSHYRRLQETRINLETDWDVVGPLDEVNQLKNNNPSLKIEPIDIEDLNNREICESCVDHSIECDLKDVKVIGMKGLAIFKRSHLHRPKKFRKHIVDYHSHGLKDALVGMRPNHQQLLEERIRLTKLAYGDNTPSLNKSNDAFFNDPIRASGLYVLDHDDIHEVVKYEDVPMYEKMKPCDSMEKAMCSKDMWEKFTHKQKINTVLEETHTIALERFLIPERLDMNPQYSIGRPWGKHSAFSYALEKVCTTLCSGWFRDFAIDNWLEIRNSMDHSYDQKFFESQTWLNALTKRKEI